MRTILIIGAGASGLMAAIHAKTKENKVILLEQNEKAGKKLLLTGNGKCNLGNRAEEPENFCGPEREHIETIIKSFGTKETEHFFTNLGMLLKDRNGYLYPFSGQASTVVNLLLQTCRHLGIEIYYGVRVFKIERQSTGFLLHTNQKNFAGNAVIVAAGSKAAPKTGSNGTGYQLLSDLGLSYEEPLPALTPLISSSVYCKALMGVRTEAVVTLYINKRFIAKETGELQLTDYGISGIPVFQISHLAAQALQKSHSVEVLADFLPMFGKKQLENKLTELKGKYGKRTVAECLDGFLNQKLVQVIMKANRIKNNVLMSSLKEEEIKVLCYAMKNFHFPIMDTMGFDKAQTCCGGIYLSQLNPETMETLAIPELYVTGEILNMNGKCGGYNLQWAWATGYLAGIAARKRKKGNEE